MALTLTQLVEAAQKYVGRDDPKSIAALKWERYYDQDADGNAAPKPEYADGGTWQAYMASKS